MTNVKQRLVLTICTDRAADWEIEIERNGKWLPTVYGGCARSVDEAYISAKRYAEAIEQAAASRPPHPPKDS